MKNVLLLALVVCLLLSVFAFAEAAEPTVYTSGDFQYILLSDGTAEIVDYSGEAEVLTIPDRLAGHKVTSIGDMAFLFNDFLKKITIPASIENFGDTAFRGDVVHVVGKNSDAQKYAKANDLMYCIAGDAANWDAVTEGIDESRFPILSFDDGYQIAVLNSDTACLYRYEGEDNELIVPQEMGGFTIRGVSGSFLVDGGVCDITFPATLQYFQPNVNPFACCYGLHTIRVAPDNPYYKSVEGVLIDKRTSAVVSFPMIAESGSFVIPEGVLEIMPHAFPEMSYTKSVVLPNSLVHVTGRPFVNVLGMQEVIVSPNHSYYKIDSGALIDKRSDTLVYFPGAREETSFSVPEGIVVIGSSAFAFNKHLLNVTMPDSVKVLEDGAFENCYKLTDIVIPDGAVEIGYGAFFYCESLKSVTIPDSVIAIGNEAFSGCDQVTLIVDRGSYAEQYAIDNGIEYTYADAPD